MTEPHETWGPPTEPSQPQGRSWLPTCLIGCLVVFVVGLLVCGGALWFLAPKMREMGSDFARQAIVSTVNSSELSEDDKQDVTAQVDRVVDAYKTGEIGTQDVARIFEELSESPLFGLLIVFATETKYIDPSGLTDEEKTEGHLTLQRIARGVFEKKIDPEQLEAAMDHISDKKSDGNRRFHDKVSDDALRAFLTDGKQVADTAEIPVEPYALNVGEEFKRVIDSALNTPKG